MEAMEPLMTIDEVAEYLRVPVLTIRWLRQEGRFRPAVKVGRRLTWERSAVVAWVERAAGSGGMSVQRYTSAEGKVRYRARVKHHGREVATRVFDRKRDAEAWEEDQKRRLRLGEWFDPRRGRVALSVVAVDWLDSRQTIKRNSLALEAGAWKRHIEPKFGKVPVSSITTAEVSTWVGRLVAEGIAPSTAARYLGVFRRLLAFAVQDGRVTVNVAAAVKPPTAGYAKREGQYLTREEIAGAGQRLQE